jgi:hypothetical protein
VRQPKRRLGSAHRWNQANHNSAAERRHDIHLDARRSPRRPPVLTDPSIVFDAIPVDALK